MTAEPSRFSSPVKVGLIGAGQRLLDTYAPIFKNLHERYEVVGFTTRTTHTSRKFESSTGYRPFASAQELVEQGRPTFLISAVNDPNVGSAILRLLDFKVPILTETPLAWSVSDCQKIIMKAAADRTLVGVAEQFPYLPIEQFKKDLIGTGIFGNIYAAYNDFSTYSYHGTARFRRYLKGKPISVRCSAYDFGSAIDPRIREEWTRIKWQVGAVSFDDGSMLFHQFSDYYIAAELNFLQSARIYGTTGAMVDQEIQYLNQKSGQFERVLVIRKEGDNTLERIEANLPGIGSLTWINPYAAYPFKDDQIAVATLLDGMCRAIETGQPPLYPADEFLDDVAIVNAFRFSAGRNGAVISLPLNEKLQKIRNATSPSFWKQKTKRLFAKS